MRVLGSLVALAFVAFVVFVGIAVLGQGDSTQPDEEIALVQCLDGSVQERCPPAPSPPEEEHTTTHSAVQQAPVVVQPTLVQLDAPPATNRSCHTIGEGLLEEHQVFGSTEASHIHVSYWTPAGPDQRERDVILPGGHWQRAAGVGGYFWVFTGCTDAQVEEQVRLHQARKQEELGDRHAGWGDATFFTRLE